jgi:hypothetical protein
VALLFALAAPAAAMTGPDGLSPRLAELASPSVRALSHKGQAKKLGLAPRGPGSLLRRGNRVLAYVRFDGGALSRLASLRAAGAQIIDASRRYQTITVAVRPADLRRLARLGGVRRATEVLTPLVRGDGPVTAATPYLPCFGSETSEGDVQLRAADARAKFEVAGSGTKVGILSDSFDRDATAPTGALEDVVSGDLPGPGNPCGETTPVEVLDDSEFGGADEGRAMAQIVHDLAPGAAISFATAFKGETDFADNIAALAAAGAKLVVDDVSYFEEPFFQEGPIGVAVSEATADHDVAYFSAAGNDNLVDGSDEEIASWEAPAFRDSGTCPAAVAGLGVEFNPSHCMDFDPEAGAAKVDRTFGITVEAGEILIIDLQWAEPWEGVTTDLDAFLLDQSGNQILAESTADNVSTGSKRPVEILGWENPSSASAKVQLVINRFAGAGARLKFILLQNGGGVSETEYEESSLGDVVGPTIFGHNGGKDAMTVGAIRFNTNAEPEYFSSRGPVTHYFEPVNGILPAAALGSPQVLAKPDLIATDGGANTFFGSCLGTWRFFGTSAAAPHAAAVGALEREADSLANAEAVKQAQRDAGLAVGAFPATAVGAGLLDAVGTLEELGVTPPSPSASPVEAPAAGPCLPPRKPPVPTPSPPPPTGPITSEASPPQTFIRKRPRKLVLTRGRTAKVVFRFGSNRPGVTFACRIDGGLFRSCGARFVRRFGLGPHNLRVVAQAPAGSSDQTPASYRFRVKRVD